jgi:hypothetical protein
MTDSRQLVPRRVIRGGLVVICLLLAVMWVYAFVFASRESINLIGDKAWQEYAEKRCMEARLARNELADFRKIEDVGPDALARRADIVDQATQTLEDVIDDIAAQPVADEKGQAIVPLWIADYRTYIQDRRDYAEMLRRGENEPFAETRVDGIPLSEKVSTFATANRMPACQAPVDLSV